MDEHLKKVQEDIDGMNKVFDGSVEIEGTKAPGAESASAEEPATEEPKTEAVATEAPKTESPETDVPKTDAPKTSAPATGAPTTEPPKTDAPETEAPETSVPETEEPTEEPATEAPTEDESERLKRENEALRAKVNELSKPKEQPKPSAPETPAPATDAPVEVINFLEGLDADELTRNPEEFNKLLNIVYSKGLSASEKVIVEKVLRSIPDIIKTSILTINSLREASEQFYKDNEDLAPFKKVVGAVFEEVASENPDKEYSELFEDVAKGARKNLELVRKATEEDKDKDKNS